MKTLDVSPSQNNAPASLAPAIAALVVFAVVAALFHVWVHMQVITVGYELSRETRLTRELAELNQRLRLELGTRLDPAQVERAAKDRLGLQPPDPRAIRVIKRGEAP